jgi:ferredoxin
MSELADLNSALEASSGSETVASEPPAAENASGAAILRFPGQDESGDICEEPSAAELRMFCRTGIAPDTSGSHAGRSSLYPAVLHPFISGFPFRSPFPILFERTTVGIKAASLSTSIDEFIDTLDGEGDSIEIRKRGLLMLENRLREAVSDESVQNVIPLIDSLGPELLKSSNGKKDRFDAYQTVFKAFRDSIHPDGKLVPFSLSGMLGLMVEYVNAETEKRASVFREEIDWLSASLADLLRFEEDDSAGGLSAERLKHTVGGAYSGEFDFGSLSHLLEDAPRGSAMEPSRRTRIDTTLSRLTELSGSLFGESRNSVFENVEELTTELEERTNRFTELVKSIQIARLEIENRYREENHDGLFDAFNSGSVDEIQRRAFPPVIGFLTGEESTVSVTSVLQDRWPVRILSSFDRVFDDRGLFTAGASLAGSLVPMGRVFVQQSCLSMADFIREGFEFGSTFEGSSLISLFTGSEDTHDGLEPYFRAAVASDTRGFPSFRYSPGPDEKWVDQFDAGENEQAECVWPEVELDLDAEDEHGSSMSILVTTAEFMGCDSRFSSQFLPISPSFSDDHLIPLAGFLALDTTDRQDSVPFLWMCDSEGRLVRCAVSPLVVETTRAAGSRWAMIQEWSGLRSSIAEKMLDSVRDEMRLDQEAAIQAVTKEFESRMESTTDSLARQIVDNIAAGMLGVRSPVTSMGVQPRREIVPKTDTASESPPEEKIEAPHDEDEEDLALPLDDPYIDTPLCTTCNECTDLNGLIFAYDDEKQAYIKDAAAGPFRDIVLAAEKCPVRIIHPGKPLNSGEAGLDEWVERSKPFL